MLTHKFVEFYERIRSWRGDESVSYHLLENGSGYSEKEEGAETSVPDLESHRISARTPTSKRRNISCRWLRMPKVLLPSFLHASTAEVEPNERRPTAWLDGLRGIAALFVVMHHMSLIWFSWDIHNGWTSWNDHLIQLPIIRLAVSGRANVMVFFVISGYALSLKPLSLIQKDQCSKMYQALASSIFRRHSRLFIPAIVICAPAPVITYLGGYGGEGMPGAAIKPMRPPRFESIWRQFGHYIQTIMALSDVYNPGRIAWVYSDSLWTLPIEFRSSLVVFTMLLALSRCTTRARVVITSCVAFYSFWYFRWGELLFIGGMLVVESGLPSQRSARIRGLGVNEASVGFKVRRNRSPWYAPSRSQAFRQLCYIAAFLTALFILSMPEQGRGAANSYGFRTLAELIPARFHAAGAADYFWKPVAAIFLVLVIDKSQSLQRIFTTGLAQYLGRVSFALYLVHMLILHSLGYWLGKYFLQLTGSDPNWQYGTGIGLAVVTVGFVIIWVADLGSRFVDANAVWFTAWVYAKLCKTTVQSTSSKSNSASTSSDKKSDDHKNDDEKKNVKKTSE
ncbi:acyltransferase family-domain-containing protein [Xylaria acuta]|nr:acyltransferase family-domain-containing protein [Xylaria acuta]